jgi:hypothetical protein
VIDDIHQDTVTNASRPEFYVCIPRIRRDNPLYGLILSRYMELAVRTDVSPDTMIGALRSAITKGESAPGNWRVQHDERGL